MSTYTIQSIRNFLSLLGIAVFLFSCSFDEGDLFDFGDEVAEPQEEVFSPVYLSFQGEAIGTEIQEIRGSTAVEALSELDTRLDAAELEGTGFYYDFLKNRLDVVRLFKNNNASLTDVNNAVFSFIEVDSLYMEANLLPMSISFSENGELSSLKPEGPINIQFLFDDGINEELTPVTFEADSIVVLTTDEDRLFISYVERLIVGESTEYTYSLEIESGQNSETDYVITQRYLIGSGTIAFKLENRQGFIESVYNITQDSEVLLNSNIRLEKDEQGEYLSGNLQSVVGQIEIIGEMNRTEQLLEKLQGGGKEVVTFNVQSEIINDSFQGHISLIAQDIDSKDFIADVTVDSKVQENGIVTGYTFLYPDSEVIFLPDFLQGALNKVDKDFKLFSSVLR